jgi:hypothetical protein
MLCYTVTKAGKVRCICIYIISNIYDIKRWWKCESCSARATAIIPHAVKYLQNWSLLFYRFSLTYCILLQTIENVPNFHYLNVKQAVSSFRYLISKQFCGLSWYYNKSICTVDILYAKYNTRVAVLFFPMSRLWEL